MREFVDGWKDIVRIGLYVIQQAAEKWVVFDSGHWQLLRRRLAGGGEPERLEVNRVPYLSVTEDFTVRYYFHKGRRIMRISKISIAIRRSVEATNNACFQCLREVGNDIAVKCCAYAIYMNGAPLCVGNSALGL